MSNIYGEGTQVSDVTEASIRGIIQGAQSREIHLSGLGTFIGALPPVVPSPESTCPAFKKASCK